MGLFSPKLDSRIQKKLDTYNPIAFAVPIHITGLPLMQGCAVQIYYTNEKIIFGNMDSEILFDMNEVISIEKHFSTDVQKYLVSSIRDAIVGNLLFGTLGAIIGGRVKQKTVSDTKTLLVITYKEDEYKQIILDATGDNRINKIIEHFAENHKKDRPAGRIEL